MSQSLLNNIEKPIKIGKIRISQLKTVNDFCDYHNKSIMSVHVRIVIDNGLPKSSKDKDEAASELNCSKCIESTERNIFFASAGRGIELFMFNVCGIDVCYRLSSILMWNTNDYAFNNIIYCTFHKKVPFSPFIRFHFVSRSLHRSRVRPIHLRYERRVYVRRIVLVRIKCEMCFC